MTEATPPPAASAPMRKFVVCDQDGEIIEIIYADTRDEAIDTFCRPALRKEAYFGPDGEWSWEEEEE